MLAARSSGKDLQDGQPDQDTRLVAGFLADQFQAVAKEQVSRERQSKNHGHNGWTHRHRRERLERGEAVRHLLAQLRVQVRGERGYRCGGLRGSRALVLTGDLGFGRSRSSARRTFPVQRARVFRGEIFEFDVGDARSWRMKMSVLDRLQTVTFVKQSVRVLSMSR